MKIVTAVSQRSDGSMKLGDANLENRRRFFASLGIDSGQIVAAGLEHGSTVAIAHEEHAGTVINSTDGLMTATPGLYLSVTIADCLPVFFSSIDCSVVGIAHAGWRGLALDILGSTVKCFRSEFGKEPNELRAEIGPGVCRDHYAVPPGRLAFFDRVRPVAEEKNGETHLDLKETARKRLAELGVWDVEVSLKCTYCLPVTYFSHRRDQTDPIEAMLAITGIAPAS